MKVIIYSTKTCPWCDLAKNFFKKNNISFIDYDVSANEEKAGEMIKKSGQVGVPVIDIDGKIIIGFDKERIEEIIKEKKQ